MDLATLGGLAVTVGLIVVAILLGSSLTIFIDVPSMAIVVGGTIGVCFMAFPGGVVVGALKAGKNAVFNKPTSTQETIQLLSELSNRARREGLLSLESAAQETEDDFMKRGLLMVVDGHEASAIEEVLYEELDKIEERHKASAAVWDAIGAYGPAMGMIGTLVGLVQMLQQMDDPNAIGPAMAVALLTTFYGSLLANIVGIPVANKLKARSGEEIMAKGVIAQGLLSILNGENPRFMVDRLNASLAPTERYEEAA
jgi:chemotaxis protein MotA